MVIAAFLQGAVESAARQGTWLAPWAATTVFVGPLLLVAVVALALLRALVRQRRYVAHSVLDDESQAAVKAALVDAERRTEGEIVPVVLERSDGHPEACWLAALVSLLAGSALLVSWLPWQQPLEVIALQIVAGAVGWVLARFLPDLQRMFVSEARATEVAEEQAVQEFHRAGLHKTKGATGVLLFVSLLERRVIVMGDEGIHSKVGAEYWTTTTESVLRGIARGSLRDGLIAGIAKCGAVLAEHFPAKDGDVNELPDRLIVRRE